MSAIDTTLQSTLTAGTALTALLAGTTSVYQSAIPAGASFPVVTYNLQAGGDENVTPRRAKSLLYSVKAVSKTSAANASAIDAQIDALLHEATLSVSGWTNFWTMREEDYAYAEVTPEGQTYWHAGGVYRIRLCE